MTLFLLSLMDPQLNNLRINFPKYFYRFAERTADELKKLREELAELATPEI